jgi:DNA segregation ATPase FtsK/SpoIIIE, S-DNA-T family
MLGLLDALKNAVRDFAAREEKLKGVFHVKTSAESEAFDAETKRLTENLGESIDGAEIIFHTAKENIQSHFERRKIRITRAHSNVRNKIVGDTTAEESRRKQQNQTARHESEQQKEADKIAAENAFQETGRRIAELRAALAEVEHESRKTFRGHGAFHKLPDDEDHRSQPAPAHEIQMLDEVEQLVAKSRKSGGAGRGFFGALFNRGKTAPAAAEVAGNLAKAKRLLDISEAQAAQRYQQDFENAETEFVQRKEALNQQFKELTRWAIEARGSRPLEAERRTHRAHQKNEEQRRANLERAEHDHAETVASVRHEAEIQTRQLGETHKANVARLQSDHEAQWDALESEWKSAIQPLYEKIRAANDFAEKLFPEWNHSHLENWNPPKEFTNAAKFGRIEIELDKFAEAMPKDKRLALPGPVNFSAPLSLVYPQEGSILFETTKSGGDEAAGVINNIIYRLLATTPPGKLSFTIFDPVGLGQNFAGLMHLADYEDSNITSRIWTQQNQFEEKLAELSEHMEKVIQMYLRNEYATITEYNAQAGTIAEKYHILVIASFPVNFSDTAAKRLRNIAASGARCGVYTLIHWDQRNQAPQDFVPDELRKNSVRLIRGDSGFNLANWRNPGAKLILDAPPSPEFATEFLHEVGERGKDANRVEVPFAQIAPADSEIWSEATTNELRVPIGRSGATKLQYLAIGKDTRQHALIAGKTGSGKSTLFHVIITNLALWCSPEQVEFYLVDFKKGVEFKCYASRKLPHARVVAIESDREFGLSVLQRVDEELARRGDLFRKLGAQDVAGYKRAGGTEAMPRSLLIIDEFQEFFTEEDRISQGAAVLLDRIVRQGRAFGIHVLLGSQTLGGAYTLARATIGQMVIRIALQCNEADAYLIMDQDNPAPRLLSRPGEGIYNDTAGSVEGNNPFQVVWLADNVRDNYLQKIHERAGQAAEKYPGPFVFEGNAPADVRENNLLNALLKSPNKRPDASANIWLGAPNAIKGPTQARFQRQSGSNLLIVGQNDDATLSMLAVSLVSLAAQYPAGAARFVLLDSAPPSSPERDFLDRVAHSIPHEVIRAKSGDVTEIMSGLAAELKRHGDDTKAGDAPETFVLIHGLHNYKKLRQEDEFSFSSSPDGAAQPAAILLNLINEGPAHGFHVIASCDSYNNVNRFLGRKNLGEFEMRILFQMSASDSASLIDAPAAATLGLHRALLYNDREGYLETFRPYAKPGNEWIEQVAKSLK